MARSFRFLPSLVIVAAAAQAQACSDDLGSYNVVDDRDGRRNTTPDGAAADRAEEAPLTTLRIANLAPGAAAFDVCYQAARSGMYEGPLLRTGKAAPDTSAGNDASDLDVSPIPPDDNDNLDAAAEASAGDDGGDASVGLAYGTVSKYVSIAATGTLVLALVPPDATTCSGAVPVGTVTLDPGKLSTVALLAEGDGGRNVIAFTDDRQTEPNKARVRIIHAADADAVAVRVLGAQTTAVAERVEPRRPSSPSGEIPVDALGFATVAPVAPPASLVIAPLAPEAGESVPWQSEAIDLDLRGESLHTGFVLGAAPEAFAVLWCADKSTTGDRTTCTLLR